MFIGMLAAIGLDDEPFFRAGEVDNVRPDRRLPPEFEAHEPVGAQRVPEFSSASVISLRMALALSRWRRGTRSCGIAADPCVWRGPQLTPPSACRHLPREGGDRSPRRFRVIFNNDASKRESRDAAISPLAGEMPTGRGGRELQSHRFTSQAVTRSPVTGSFESFSWIPCARSSSRMRSASAKFLAARKARRSVICFNSSSGSSTMSLATSMLGSN